MKLAQNRSLSKPAGNAPHPRVGKWQEVLSVGGDVLKDTDRGGKPVQITGIFLQGDQGNVSGDVSTGLAKAA
jgi:hypothetical protein